MQTTYSSYATDKKLWCRIESVIPVSEYVFFLSTADSHIRGMSLEHLSLLALELAPANFLSVFFFIFLFFYDINCIELKLKPTNSLWFIVFFYVK